MLRQWSSARLVYGSAADIWSLDDLCALWVWFALECFRCRFDAAIYCIFSYWMSS